MEERIQKIISKSGVTSRRKAEHLITSRRVRVNNILATLGQKADIEKDIITVDGNILEFCEKIYIMLHKPVGYITSNFDPQARPTVLDLVNIEQRIFPVGRLDYNTSGLIILTNDGELSNFVSHPRNNIEKKYYVVLSKPLSRFHQGIISESPSIDKEKVYPFIFHWISEDRKKIKIKLHEGKNRIIRRVFKNYGYKIEELKRLEIGTLFLGELGYGKWRFISKIELGNLFPR
ncbi:MAG: pseudouridine synthase [Chloroflexi bacterium]|nr:pseudouridine synthase [Chloroflexota bacterium]|tara:strand:+ start:22245 stop:22943 length:699 start_codon:yes stop_codon:yes gene_type:complete